MTAEKAKNPVQSIERAHRILEILKERDGARIVELNQQIDLSKATIHSYLTTLRQHGYVSKEENTYHVGLGCLSLGGFVRDREPLYLAGREGADELAQNSGELVGLMKEWNGRCTYLYQARGDRAMEMDSYPGVQLPMHCTASGKAILAELPDQRVREIIESHGLAEWTENTIVDTDDLLDELETIRSRGISFDDEERINGMRGIGISITNDETLLGAIALAGPINRLEGDRYWEELPEQIRKIQRMIEVKATYSPD